MKDAITLFMDTRIDEALAALPRENSEYALAMEKRNYFLSLIDPLLHTQKDLTLCPSDFENLRDYLEQDFTLRAIEERSLYRQGFLDCAALLESFGLLSASV